MTAKLDPTLRFHLDAEVERRLGLSAQQTPAGCYLTDAERDLLAARLTSAAKAQIVVIDQAAQQSGHLFAGHDWRDISRTSCTCRACIITRAEDMYDELSELAN